MNDQVIFKSKESQQGLISALSEEIAAYRQRQLTTFREVVIVLALITWGAGHLEPGDAATLSNVRYLAAVGCLLVGLAGIIIIWIYKKRIYYVRRSRSFVTQQLLVNPKSPLYYPVDWTGIGDSSYKTWPSSHIYNASVAILSALSCCANYVLA